MKNQIKSISKLSQHFFLIAFAIILVGTSVSCGQPHEHKPEALFKAMEIEEGSRVADVGGGDGDYTVRMSPIVNKSGRIFLVDIDPDKLEELHKRLKEREINNVTPVYSVPGNPMLPNNSLDAILVRNAYHEFRNYMAMLAHLKQSLKPGGRLVMAEPMEKEVAGADRDEQMDDHSLAMKFARKELKKAGFKITKEVDEFIKHNDHHRYWMIVAKRPTSNSDT